ncbi:hypothetical protein BOC52_35825 [Burkholderia pseudomallei]|nr:hypothetical protein BOC52_35825 [Burkholderia pseudomallei]ARL67947.1 hypothetical protein BOC53_32905 [Burkholderia pseudomallei]
MRKFFARSVPDGEAICREIEGVRTLLIHGARAVLRTAPTKHDKKHAWALALKARRGANRA